MHVNKDNNSSDSCQFFVSRRNLPILSDGLPECNKTSKGSIVFRCTPKRLARSFERNHLVGASKNIFHLQLNIISVSYYTYLWGRRGGDRVVEWVSTTCSTVSITTKVVSSKDKFYGM
jgi:hypothetical protein